MRIHIIFAAWISETVTCGLSVLSLCGFLDVGYGGWRVFVFRCINLRLKTVIITSLNVCGWAVGKLLLASVVLCHNNFFYVGRRFFDCVRDEVDFRYSVIITRAVFSYRSCVRVRVYRKP